MREYTLVEGEKVIAKGKDVVKIFKDHFEKIVDTFKIDRPILSDLSGNPVLNAIKKFSHHASVLRIKGARNSSDCFFLKVVTIEDICKETLASDASKSTQSDDIPKIILTFFLDFFKRILMTLLN